jgi:histone-lysine N-methyltransferase SETMAR
LQTFKWEVLGHPSHSPDLAPSDCHLFGKLKEHIAGEMFDEDDEAKDEALTWLNEQAAEFYDSGIKKLVSSVKECIEKRSEYVETNKCVSYLS